MVEKPAWVRKHDKPGIEIRLQRDHWYAYQVTSRYDPKLGRSRKITQQYLGKVTPQGIVKPRTRSITKVGGILDAGNIAVVRRFSPSLETALKEFFPTQWQDLMALAALRLCYREPASRMQVRYETSLAKRYWPEAHVDKNALPGLLRDVGFKWQAQREFFRHMSRDDEHVAIDLSHVFSESQNIPFLEYGHNGDDVWRPQAQVLLMWGTSTHRPGYLKLLSGATHSAQTIANAVKEADLEHAIAILDKGFWSPENIQHLEDAGVHYAMALRRDLDFLGLAPPSAYAERFLYGKSVQWWRAGQWNGRAVYTYFDKEIAAQEEARWLLRVKDGETSDEEYRQALNGLGTLSIITDSGLSAEQVYSLYRERREVEYGYDALQNTLGADVTWMRSTEALRGYFFVQFLALHLYAQVVDHLKRKKKLSQYSVFDVLTHLSKVTVVEIDGKDYMGAVTRQTQAVAEVLELPITDNLGL